MGTLASATFALQDKIKPIVGLSSVHSLESEDLDLETSSSESESASYSSESSFELG